MRDLVSSRWNRWTTRAGVAALLVLVWAVVIPEGYVWTGVAAVGLMLAATLFVGGRSILAIPEVAPVEAEHGRGVVFPERVAPLGKDGGLGAKGEVAP
jgi:hypothetical protein